jgi:hypothetical protein
MFKRNEGDEDVVSIPMFAAGTNIFIKTRTPTQEKLDTCQQVILTSDVEWEPNDIKLPQAGAVRRDTPMDLGSDPGEIYNVLGFSQRLVASCLITHSCSCPRLTDDPYIPN